MAPFTHRGATEFAPIKKIFLNTKPHLKRIKLRDSENPFSNPLRGNNEIIFIDSLSKDRDLSFDTLIESADTAILSISLPQ